MSMLHSSGRGRHYSRWRGLVESTLRIAYPFSWPARAWALVPGATDVRLLRHDLRVEGAPRPPLRIAFVSDLHLGPTTPRQTLDRAFAHISAAKPDVLVLGGDYVFLDATPARARELEERVAAIDAPTKLAVLGNHDLWTNHPILERALERAGAKLVINEAVRLPAPYADVAIFGIDDPWTGAPDAPRALRACGDAPIKIAVCHSPDGLPLVRGEGVRLFMCGHTHGGHIALPGYRPVIVPGPMGKLWPFGLHDLPQGLTLFVSRGIGGIELPIRTYAPPDVALFTLSFAGPDARTQA